MHINSLTAAIFPVHTDQESVLEGIPHTPTSTLSKPIPLAEKKEESVFLSGIGAQNDYR